MNQCLQRAPSLHLPPLHLHKGAKFSPIPIRFLCSGTNVHLEVVLANFFQPTTSAGHASRSLLHRWCHCCTRAIVEFLSSASNDFHPPTAITYRSIGSAIAADANHRCTTRSPSSSSLCAHLRDCPCCSPRAWLSPRAVGLG